MTRLLIVLFLLTFVFSANVYAVKPGPVTASPSGVTWIVTPNEISVQSDDATTIYYTVENTYDGSPPDNPEIPTSQLFNGRLEGPYAIVHLTGTSGQYRRTKIRFVGCNDSECGPASPAYSYAVQLSNASNALLWNWGFTPRYLGPFYDSETVYGQAEISNSYLSTKNLKFAGESYGYGGGGVWFNGNRSCCFYDTGFGLGEFPWGNSEEQFEELDIAPGETATIDFLRWRPGSFTPPIGSYTSYGHIAKVLDPWWDLAVPKISRHVKKSISWDVGPPEVTNFGLFMGAKDDDGWVLDLNAIRMGQAFRARPNTEATFLTGDLSLDSGGNEIDPISVADLRQKLQNIHSHMRPGDTFTLYINSHGGSFNFSTGEGDIEGGVGDETIVIGDRNNLAEGWLWDNVLAEELTPFVFDGYRVTVFLDACHGGGFWGGTDFEEIPPGGLGFNDLNQLENIALYSAAAEDKNGYGDSKESFTFWGQALFEAFQSPISWTPNELGLFLKQRTLELAEKSGQEAPVWYELEPGDAVEPDIALIGTFEATSPDFNGDSLFLSDPEPDSQFDSLIEGVRDLGPGSSLFDKMTDADLFYEAGDLVAACGTLGAFVNQVRAQSGKKVSVVDAGQLVASAEFTMASIGCN